MPHDVVPAALVVTDLDGTLLNADHRIGTTDRQALHALGAQRVCRVAAMASSTSRRVTPLTLISRCFPEQHPDWSTRARWRHGLTRRGRRR